MVGELVLAGWVLVRPVATPAWAGDRLPDRIVTVSNCIQDDLPVPEWWNWTQDRDLLDQARRAQAPDARIVAVGMVPAEADAFMASMGGPDQPMFALLRQQRRAEGRLLGFEVVGAEPQLDFHSWHCHGYADRVKDALGIGANDVGLLASADDARRVRDWMLALPDRDAPEPVDWTYLALITE